jgi:hypothetical protein
MPAKAVISASLTAKPAKMQEFCRFGRMKRGKRPKDAFERKMLEIYKRKRQTWGRGFSLRTAEDTIFCKQFVIDFLEHQC